MKYKPYGIVHIFLIIYNLELFLIKLELQPRNLDFFIEYLFHIKMFIFLDYLPYTRYFHTQYVPYFTTRCLIRTMIRLHRSTEIFIFWYENKSENNPNITNLLNLLTM